MANLIVILRDQLSFELNSLRSCDPQNDHILMCELKEDATYVRHHKKKLILILSAMRHFHEELKAKGYQTHYISIDNPDNSGSLEKEVQKQIKQHPYKKVIFTAPSEYRTLKVIKKLQASCSNPVEILEDERFLCSPKEFQDWARGRKQLRMEFFYREMRKKYSILMEGEEPEGGQWNFDKENRSPPKQGLNIPKTFVAKPDSITQEVIALVEKHFNSHFGEATPFHFAVNRKQALIALDEFMEKKLCLFGQYQDAMLENEPWMYHSHISFYLNCGLLNPLECIKRAEAAYRNKEAPLNSVEGFIRQIMGWREYVRGIYWLKMPQYSKLNFFEAKRPLPSFYWTGKTSMNCLKQCVKETKENGYAHHIQRLMVLGNFALIAGIHPSEVNEWYLIVYADAYEWVELPNVSGMILYADGGYLASKPYAAGGAYINKMSNYCKNCRYSVSKKTGEGACPFNYLYWDFLQRNRDQLESNQRVGMMYNTYDRMADDKKKAIQNDAKIFFEGLKNDEV